MTLVLTLLLLAILHPSHALLHYEVVEEGPARSFYRNIVTESGLDLRYDDAMLRELTLAFLSVNKEVELFDLRDGILENNQPIDRDLLCPNQERCSIELAIAVQPSQFFERISIRIDLLDLNDHAPEFPEPRIVRRISENARNGVLFPLQGAQDPDSPDNGVAQYHLASSSDKFSLKVSRELGGSFDLQLVLKGKLDREQQDFYQLQVLSFDGGQPSRSGSVVIDIVVDDVNDNNPAFEFTSYNVEVAEDLPLNWTVANVYASDPDEGANGEVIYSFTPKTEQLYGHLFEISPKHGKIVLKSHLDYETYQSITLGVIAEDQGINSVPMQTIVVINILDINDNAPVITLNEHNAVSDTAVQIPEHSPRDMFVAHLTVEDPDVGEDGVRCSMDSDHFTLVKMYSQDFKVVTSQVIDREVTDRRVIESFLLVVECVDQGAQSKRSVFNLTVLISDINDHAPRFQESSFNVSIKENNQPMAFITRTYALDPDAGNNGSITYMIQGDREGRFRIDPVTGVITAAQVFDREEVDLFEFEVVAQDHGVDPRFSKAKVAVHILDEEDEPPKFIQPRYTFEVHENIPPQTEVGVVQAIDRDLPPNNRFMFHLDTPNEAFRMDSSTGRLFTTKSLDREEKSVHTFAVVAQSDTIPPLTDKVTVTVVVADRNDNDPEVLFPSLGNDTVSIGSTAPLGHLVATVDAHDVDCDDQCRLTYSILSGADRGEFVIRPNTGEILVNADLDSYAEKEYTLVIRVSDNGDPERLTSSSLVIQLTKSVVSPQASRAGVALSSTHLAIIVGVILGCLLIASTLVIAILVIRRKNKMAATKPPAAQGQLYWPRSADLSTMPSAGSVSPTDSERSGNLIVPRDITLQGEDSVAAKLAELAEHAAFIKPKLAVLHPPPLNGRRTPVLPPEDPTNNAHSNGSSPLPVKTFHSPVPGQRPSSTSPRKLESFTDWLHAESFHLKQEGHSYHVTDKDKKSVRFHARPPGGSSVSTLSSTGSDADYPSLPADASQIMSDSKYPPYNSKLGSLV
ncbi:hypothetical protein CAPTEDRAFT_218800 [Capitella teleta]|uniref:Protocadherin-20 n=1 Tax=Capitella teleta TaxID=283909 RepID=R7TWW4_CAPTE|nr:hypothetical protein CAPTEDRAFT_218800 [Capitella teleta]|eukprot:ELT98229.1 hypothetical protein CAPTEDRAFT_218800 [Capitella teleta]